MRGDVIVRSVRNFQHEALIRGHAILADEPRELGGDDAGPTPQLLLLGSLGT